MAATDKEINVFREFVENRVEQRKHELEQQRPPEVSLEQFTIEADTPLVGRTIRESGIRDKAACLVIGIERNGTSTMNHTRTQPSRPVTWFGSSVKKTNCSISPQEKLFNN